ncbi:tripartite tricarboxylate transporter substrate binding protein [Hydrogenophaga sp. 2FB]|uniref:Bug family tripartite tricarboxylate transporter substrate binding protein n=1 Tax=Hydrogenophaga sp. 2FB TaxID=2502187 RepID=UPI0010F5F283|nr:tripartite tricarboxylate transporter substrate binding protein [Hydrogenophaga sp. 2FB]
MASVLTPTRRGALAALTLGVACPALFAQGTAWPAQTVRIVVPYAAGGGVDLLARMLADRLQRQWGQSVVVENKAGGATVIGAMAVTKAAPDGLTLLLTSEATITSNPFLFAKLAYDPVRELAPISQLVSLPQMVVANPQVGANNMAELVAMAKARPDALSYASYGSGSLPHLLFESLKARTGASFVHVPYKGISPAVAAVQSGEVNLTLAGVSGALALLRAGKLKALAVGRATRLTEMPDVPTLREAGLADIDPRESWFGLFATGGTPAAVVQKIHQDVAAIGNDPAFRESVLLSRGFEPVFSTPSAFAKFIEADMRQKAQLIRISGAKAE